MDMAKPVTTALGWHFKLSRELGAKTDKKIIDGKCALLFSHWKSHVCYGGWVLD